MDTQKTWIGWKKRTCVIINPMAECTDYETMGEATLTQSDPLHSGYYSCNKVTLPAEGFDHRRLRVRRYKYGHRRDVPVPFLVSQLIMVGQEEGLLDGLIYLMMPTGAGSSAVDGVGRRDSLVSAW